MAPTISTPQDGRTAPSISGPGYDPRGGGMSRGGGPRTPWTVYLRTGRTGSLVNPYRFAREDTAKGFRDGLVAAFAGPGAYREPKRKSIEYRHGYRTGHQEGLVDIQRCGAIPKKEET